MKNLLTDILKITAIVGPLVRAAEQKLKGAKGSEKHRVVLDTIASSVPVIEEGLGVDVVGDTELRQAVDAVIAAEVALMNAQKRVDDVVESIKAARAKKDADAKK